VSVGGGLAPAPDGPLSHVLRAALPWRDGPVLTECGKPPADGAPTLTHAEFAAQVKREGQRRASKSICMTCWDTADRHRGTSWEADPLGVLSREIGWARYFTGHVRDDPAARRFHTEVLAIAELIDRHRDEFDGLVAGLGEATSLDDRRRQGRRRARGAL
jgi:hypothetical protein